MRIVVGFPAGGLPDLVARALAEVFRIAFDTTVVVENRVGANGRLAAQAVKGSAPDGNTLLLATAAGMVHLPHVYHDLGYDPFVDFVPVANVVDADFAFAVDPKVPADTLQGFAEWCIRHPSLAAFASPGAGSLPHLMGVILERALAARIQHVAYRGANFALADLVGGHMASMFATTPFLLQPHLSGRVRILATSGATRAPRLGSVPTFREQGIEQLSITDGNWLMAPAKTSAATVDRIAAAALESVKSKEMQALIAGQDAIVAPLGPTALAALMQQEYRRRGALVRSVGFSVAP